MGWLLFLARLSFICGIFLLLSVSLRFHNWVQEDSLTSTIIIIGYFMGLVIIPLANVSLLVMAFLKRTGQKFPSWWLIVSNILFLLVLVYYIFHLNAAEYHQP